RDTAPEAAVVRVGAIVTHDEITVGRHFVRHTQFVRLGGASRVFLGEALAVNPHGALMNVNGVARKTDDALHVIRRVGSKGWFEDNDLLALGIGLQRNVPVGGGNAGVVAEAAHDQVGAE